MKFRDLISSIKGKVFLVVPISLLTIFATVVVAQQLDVTYKDLNFYLDAKKIDVTALDSNGNQVRPFIWKGVTYVPVSAVAKAFGKEVEWKDGSIYFTSKGTNNSGVSDSDQNQLDAGSRFSYSNLNFYKDYDDYDEIKVRCTIKNNSGTNYRKASFEVSAYDAAGNLLGSSVEDIENFGDGTERNLSEDIDHLQNVGDVSSVKVKFVNGY